MAKVTVKVESNSYSVPALKTIVAGELSELILHHDDMKVEIKEELIHDDTNTIQTHTH